jgi:transcriptional regulator with XRE-family HTH domain
VSTVDSQIALGRGIAERRRRYGWSQPELASLLGRPAGWLSQVERGLIPAESAPVPGALAISPLALPEISQERIPAGNTTAADIDALQDVLSGARAVPGSPIPAARSVAELCDLAARAWALTAAQQYGELAGLLGSLLPELQATAGAPGGGPAEVLELIAISYQACSAALVKLGAHDGALVAADRALAAAHQAGDLLLAAGSAYMLVRILLEVRRDDQAEAVAAAAACALAGMTGAESAEALSLCGALTLLRALIAARLGQPGVAEEQLSRARALASRLDADGPHRSAARRYRSVFGPDHVALFEIAVSIETGAQQRADRAGRSAPAGPPR